MIEIDNVMHYNEEKAECNTRKEENIMTENSYSIFDDVTMPDWVNDEPDPRNSCFYLKCLGKVGQTRKLVESVLNADSIQEVIKLG